MTHKDRFDELEATNQFTDPGGTTHTGTIGGSGSLDVENTDGTPLIADASAIQAGTDLQFSDDGDSTATLDWTGSTFSGSHTDLTNVSSNDHHTKYTDSEAVAAVEAEDPLSLPGVLTFGDAASDPAANGELARNGTDVKVYSGGSVRNLSNVGSGGSTSVNLENTDGTTLVSTDTIQAGTDLDFSDDGDGTATLDFTGSGGSGSSWAQTTVTADTTASDNDSVWVNASSSAVTVTLPSPSSSTHVRVVAMDATNTVTVSRSGSESINGTASDRVLQQDESETYESDGTNWWVV